MCGVLTSSTDDNLTGQVEYCIRSPGGNITSSALSAGIRKQVYLYVYVWGSGVDLLSEDCIMPEYMENNTVHMLEHNLGQQSLAA